MPNADRYGLPGHNNSLGNSMIRAICLHDQLKHKTEI